MVVDGPVFDETQHVLRRIAEKQPYLMRKFAPGAKAPRQIRHALLTALVRISSLRQQRPCQLILQILPQFGGAVEVQQSLSVLIAQRQQPQPLGYQNPIQIPDLYRQAGQAVKGNRENRTGLDAGQRRRTLPHQIFLRHTVRSFRPGQVPQHRQTPV